MFLFFYAKFFLYQLQNLSYNFQSHLELDNALFYLTEKLFSNSNFKHFVPVFSSYKNGFGFWVVSNSV